MLTPKEWKIVERQASKIYTDLELEIIQEIAERISTVGYANTIVANDVKIAQELGILFDDIISLVAKYNNTSYTKIKKIFEEATIKSLSFDDNIYKEAGLNPIPIIQTPYYLKVVENTIKRTNFNLNNLMQTTADTTRIDFYNAINKAYIGISSGIKSYSQAIVYAVKQIEGARIKYPQSGVERNIESAVRTNILTSVNQVCGRIQEERANELGWDLMELTAHSGARPSHAEWQGKIVSLSGKKGYLSKKDIGYGEVDGFKGINCRHDWFPYFKGSTRTYSNKELNELKNETVKYNGQDIPKYKASQIQRRYERNIREDKKEKAKWQGILKSNNTELQNIAEEELKKTESNLRKHNKVLNNFLNETGLEKDQLRLRI